MTTTVFTKLPPAGDKPAEALSLTLGEHMTNLLRHAEEKLSDEELVALAALGGEANEIAERAAEVTRGLAVLVSADDHENTPARAGSFQRGNDVSNLLLQLADSFNLIGMLTRLSDDSAHCLRSRDATRRVTADMLQQRRRTA